MEKFKALSRKEKFEHILIYYKYHILGTIAGIFILVALITHIFGPKPPEPAANVVIIGKHMGSEEMDALKEEIADIIPNEEGRQVNLANYPVNWESDDPVNFAMEQKFVIMFQARELDLLVFEEMKLDTYVQNIEEAICVPLEDEPELKEILEENQDDLIRKKFRSDEQEKVYGLSVKNNIKLKELGLGDDYVVSIPVVAINKDNAIKVIKWLYE